MGDDSSRLFVFPRGITYRRPATVIHSHTDYWRDVSVILGLYTTKPEMPEYTVSQYTIDGEPINKYYIAKNKNGRVTLTSTLYDPYESVTPVHIVVSVDGSSQYSTVIHSPDPIAIRSGMTEPDNYHVPTTLTKDIVSHAMTIPAIGDDAIKALKQGGKPTEFYYNGYIVRGTGNGDKINTLPTWIPDNFPCDSEYSISHPMPLIPPVSGELCLLDTTSSNCPKFIAPILDHNSYVLLPPTQITGNQTNILHVPGPTIGEYDNRYAETIDPHNLYIRVTNVPLMSKAVGHVKFRFQVAGGENDYGGSSKFSSLNYDICKPTDDAYIRDFIVGPLWTYDGHNELQGVANPGIQIDSAQVTIHAESGYASSRYRQDSADAEPVVSASSSHYSPTYQTGAELHPYVRRCTLEDATLPDKWGNVVINNLVLSALKQREIGPYSYDVPTSELKLTPRFGSLAYIDVKETDNESVVCTVNNYGYPSYRLTTRHYSECQVSSRYSYAVAASRHYDDESPSSGIQYPYTLIMASYWKSGYVRYESKSKFGSRLGNEAAPGYSYNRYSEAFVLEGAELPAIPAYSINSGYSMAVSTYSAYHSASNSVRFSRHYSEYSEYFRYSHPDVHYSVNAKYYLDDSRDEVALGNQATIVWALHCSIVGRTTEPAGSIVVVTSSNGYNAEDISSRTTSVLPPHSYPELPYDDLHIATSYTIQQSKDGIPWTYEEVVNSMHDIVSAWHQERVPQFMYALWPQADTNLYTDELNAISKSCDDLASETQKAADDLSSPACSARDAALLEAKAFVASYVPTPTSTSSRAWCDYSASASIAAGVSVVSDLILVYDNETK